MPLLIKLARAVQGKVAVNIGLALGIKLLVIALSIFGLSGMWQAIVADVGVTLVAILNAASLFTKFKTPNSLPTKVPFSLRPKGKAPFGPFFCGFSNRLS